MTSIINAYPPELLSLISAYTFAAGLPSASPSLDPMYLLPAPAPTVQPTSYPPACWSEPVARRTLASLSLVNRAWSAAARPWLWRRVEVRLPRSWLALVDEIAGGDVEDEAETAREVDQSIQEAAQAALKARAQSNEPPDADAAARLKEQLLETLGGPEGGIPIDLLSPSASREPSPRRLRQKSQSPARWKLMRSISDAVRNLMGRDDNGMYVPAIQDHRPGSYVRHLDFNHFRTIGMRRSVDEGVNSRFVTGDRLENVLKETPSLTAFGATEYMDGALTLPVLNELFLRGASSRGRGQPVRGRGLVIEDPNDAEAEDAARRRECKELEAVDLTGCVSAVFVNALAEFVKIRLGPLATGESSSSEDESTFERGRPRKSPHTCDEPVLFVGLQRLGLRGAKSISPHILTQFILCFPSLTHLDLSGTRATPELLEGLAASSTIRLESLSLGRCIRLTGESIRDLLVYSPAASALVELNLYGDGTFPCPLSPEELQEVLTMAPCFTGGRLRYLDISSAPLDRALLACMPTQPSLRSLGLAHIPRLELTAVVEFLRDRARNVEVLTLMGTSPELAYSGACKASLALHARMITPLCMPPFSLSGPPRAPVTRLRVVELATPLLAGLGAGAGSWRIVKSKGGRGWYVDTASGWVAERGEEPMLRRDLARDHPWREALERLADANGNVSSGVGWHARKMEVLHGHGLLGREDGLYGAVSFAYQG